MNSSHSTSYSRTTQSRLVLPPDTNHLKTIFGGQVLSFIDEIAAITAMKHAGSVVVTASIDSVDFLSSASVGDLLELESIITSTGRTSMEVFVKVHSTNMLTGVKTLTTKSFLTMVAVDDEKRPISVPKIIPESDEEKKLCLTAAARKENRLNRSLIN
jgi:acyl-CoA hydrolase